MITFVGKRCLLNYYLNDQSSTLLLDSEAQVSVINIEEFGKIFPDVKIQDICSVLDNYDTIRVQRGDDKDISFEGGLDIWVEIGQNSRSKEINLPFSMKIQKMNNTILEFNGIKHLMENKTSIETMVSILKTTFDNTDKSKIKSFV